MISVQATACTENQGFPYPVIVQCYRAAQTIISTSVPGVTSPWKPSYLGYIGIKGGSRPTAPVHDGNCGCDALCATVVGSRWEPSGESQLRRLSDRLSATTRVGQAVWLVETHTREIEEGWR